MKMVARVRLVVDVPFDADVDDAPPIVLEQQPSGRPGLANREEYEKAHVDIGSQRIDAAIKAEKLKMTVSPGKIIEQLVEEVREA